MKKVVSFLVVLAVIGISSPILADVVTNYWQAAGQSLNGRWGDVNHWSLGHIPTDDEIAVIDPLRTGGTSANFTITVDDAYTADSVTIGDPDNSTRNQTVRFAGSGSLEFSQKAQSQFIIRNCRGGIVFDGPDVTIHGSVGVLNYSAVTVRNGSTLFCDGAFTSWKGNDHLIVDDGGTVSVHTFKYLNGGADHYVLVKTGGSFVCRDSFTQDPSASGVTLAFALQIEGGSASIKNLSLTREAASLKMNAGTLKLTNKPTLALADLSQIQVTGGEMIWGFDIAQSADDPWYAYLTEHPDIVAGCGKFQMNNGTLFRHKGTFRVSQFQNLSTSASMQIDCDRLVFDGNNWPFTWNGTGTRITHLYGPTEIRVDGRDFTQAYQNCYLYCHGKFVIDLRDWSNPSIVRTMKFRGFHSADGTLDMVVRGKGGALTIGPAYTYESFSSFAVEEGVALSLGPRSEFSKVGSSTEWGPLSAESLTLGKDVTVSLTAGLQHLCASRWSVDPSVKFRVSFDANMPEYGAFPILVDLDSKDLPASLLSQIEFVDLPAGWALANAYGQISVYRRDPSALGTYGSWEWTGDAGDGKWSTAGNWHGGTSPSEGQIHDFGASDKTAIDHNGTASGGTTVGTIRFQKEAVQTYTISNKQMTYSKSSAIESYSWVPQCLKTGLRMTGGDRSISAFSVGPVYVAAGRDMDLKSGGTGAYVCNGDVRLGCKTTSGVRTLKMSSNNRLFPSYRTAMTVVSGGDIRFNMQAVAFGSGATTFRVSKGGQLQFTAGDGLFYQWTAAPASIVVDGTMNIGVPFRGGVNQSYRGSGRLNITGGTVSASANSTVSFGERLQVYPTTWSTVTADAADRALAMGANSGTPVIHVGNGWTYGPAAGVTPTASANNRAFLLANGAVATIEANGGAVRFVDGVRGFGTLAITNGTLTVEAACSADEVTLAARKGATLNLKGAQSLDALEIGADAVLTVDGAVTLASTLAGAQGALKLTGDGCITAAHGADLSNVTLDFNNEEIRTWKTVVAVSDGEIVGTPIVPNFYQSRLVDAGAGVALQCRSRLGMSVFIR